MPKTRCVYCNATYCNMNVHLKTQKHKKNVVQNEKEQYEIYEEALLQLTLLGFNFDADTDTNGRIKLMKHQFATLV